VGSRRELVVNCVHTADATPLDSFVASAVCWVLRKNPLEKNYVYLYSLSVVLNGRRPIDAPVSHLTFFEGAEARQRNRAECHQRYKSSRDDAVVLGDQHFDLPRLSREIFTPSNAMMFLTPVTFHGAGRGALRHLWLHGGPN